MVTSFHSDKTQEVQFGGACLHVAVVVTVRVCMIRISCDFGSATGRYTVTSGRQS
jgi:hypothetical protein